MRDHTHAYPVLRTVAMDKGAYYFGGPNDGTLLGSITTDRSTTGSQLTAACRDGLQQVQQQGLIVAQSPVVTRQGPGRWSVVLPYRSAGRDLRERLEIG